MQNKRRLFFAWLVALLLILTSCAPRLDATGRWTEKDASKLIEKYYQAQYPDLNPNVTFPVEDVTKDEIWQLMHIQVFRITDGIYANESFILNGEILVQMGTAFGGSGVTDMLVTDLYPDGNFELIFAYNFGSGIHQTHMAAYMPNYDASRIIECEVAYLGDLSLVIGDDGKVNAQIIDLELTEKQQDPSLVLGTLSIVKESSELFLDLAINTSLPAKYYEGISVFK